MLVVFGMVALMAGAGPRLRRRAVLQRAAVPPERHGRGRPGRRECPDPRRDQHRRRGRGPRHRDPQPARQPDRFRPDASRPPRSTRPGTRASRVLPPERHPHQWRHGPRRRPEPGHVHVRAGHRAGLEHDRHPGSMVGTIGDLLPIAVRHYINAPGPVRRGDVARATATRISSRTWSRPRTRRASGSSIRRERCAARRAPGRAFNASNPGDDPVNHGPIIALVGQGASPSNAADFRGFVALDIRNFESSTPPSNVFYNGVTARHERQHAQVDGGRLGRDRLSRTRTSRRSRPRPIRTTRSPSCRATRRASSSTRSTTAMRRATTILAAVYSGTVSSIPDFTYAVPSTATINTNQNRNGSITMSRHQEQRLHRGRDDVSAFKDWGDTGQPVGHDARAAHVQPVPADARTAPSRGRPSRPPARRRASTRSGSRATPAAPSCSTTTTRSAISIGSVNRDFSTSSGGTISLASTGATGTTTVQVSTPNNSGTYFKGTVNLSVEGGADANGVLPAGHRRAQRQPARPSPSTRAPARPSRSPPTAGPSDPASTR